MAGGLGNDAYYVNSTGDIITENAGEGIDTIIWTGLTNLYTMTQVNVENLTIAGTANRNVTGHSGANTIIGNSGINEINGGLGNNTLTGGAGADFFVFNSTLGAANVDRIMDFSVVDDTIRLENTGAGLFNAFTATGAIATTAFWIGTGAHLATDRIIYNSSTGDVFYDADGTGATAAVKFATLNTGLALTNLDFVVI